MTMITTVARSFLCVRQYVVVAAILAIFSALSIAVSAQNVDLQTFDHSTTGFPLDGPHQGVECDSCHTRGIFQGTPRTCVQCHGSNAQSASSIIPLTHIKVTNDCESCHTGEHWDTVTRIDHSVTTVRQRKASPRRIQNRRTTVWTVTIPTLGVTPSSTIHRSVAIALLATTVSMPQAKTPPTSTVPIPARIVIGPQASNRLFGSITMRF